MSTIVTRRRGRPAPPAGSGRGPTASAARGGPGGAKRRTGIMEVARAAVPLSGRTSGQGPGRARKSQEEPGRARRGTAMRVLVIEDDSELADAIGVGLRRERLAVGVALDGQAGLERALVTDYDVILLDRDLPGLHGGRRWARLVQARGRRP